jgi:hypothetical protein
MLSWNASICDNKSESEMRVRSLSRPCRACHPALGLGREPWMSPFFVFPRFFLDASCAVSNYLATNFSPRTCASRSAVARRMSRFPERNRETMIWETPASLAI